MVVVGVAVAVAAAVVAALVVAAEVVVGGGFGGAMFVNCHSYSQLFSYAVEGFKVRKGFS